MTVGILDTSVVIALGQLDSSELPDEQAITTVTLGELSVGPLIASDATERARRQARLQAVEHDFAEAMLPYDQVAARAFGTVMSGALNRSRTLRTCVSDFHRRDRARQPASAVDAQRRRLQRHRRPRPARRDPAQAVGTSDLATPHPLSPSAWTRIRDGHT